MQSRHRSIQHGPRALGPPEFGVGNAVAVGYAVAGIVVSLAGGVFALSRARAARSFYAADVYHMSARTHLRFAVLSGAFAIAFVAALRFGALTVPLLAVYALLIVLYTSSFARGFSDDE